MDFPVSPARVRISKIAGRYLVFDIKDVARLRRNHDLCGFLVGITPQAPTQNLFSGLPLEIAPEEAKTLIDEGAAYVEDDLAAHLSQLTSLDPSGRRAYIESLGRQRRAVRLALEAAAAAKEKQAAEARAAKPTRRGKRRAASQTPTDPESLDTVTDPAESTFSSPTPEPSTKAPPPPPQPGHSSLLFTPTTSEGLLTPGAHPVAVEAPPSTALQAHLHSRGYFMTPGLRFGGAYSVYPGDPFRYHAHFLANSYGWDEEIIMLDIVGSGRLATGVKKGLLIGGEQSDTETDEVDKKRDGVRVFTLEWAAM